ncbi:MAG TPA: lipopolysaccharide heptosyltransferase II [Acidobacteriota bacterium]
MKFLVRTPNWIGDAVLARPALESLRRNYPESEIWLLAKDWVKELFEMDGLSNGVLPLGDIRGPRAFARLARRLKEQRFDAGLLLTNSFASALLFTLARIPERWGYRRDGRGPFLTRSVPVPELEPPKHQVHYYLDLLKGLGLSVAAPALRMSLPEKENRAARQSLQALGLNLKRPLVILNPGAAYGPAKRWPAERFADLGALLQQKKKAEIIITGSSGEEDLAAGIASRLPRPPTVLAGRTSLRQLLGLIGQARLFVTNDTGPMHLANVLSVPVVALFGPTDPVVTGPFHPPAVVLKKEAACWPCLYRKCPYDHRCLANIKTEEVLEAALRFLP